MPLESVLQDFEKCRSVRPFAMLTEYAYYSFIINSRIFAFQVIGLVSSQRK